MRIYGPESCWEDLVGSIGTFIILYWNHFLVCTTIRSCTVLPIIGPYTASWLSAFLSAIVFYGLHSVVCFEICQKSNVKLPHVMHFSSLLLNAYVTTTICLHSLGFSRAGLLSKNNKTKPEQNFIHWWRVWDATETSRKISKLFCQTIISKVKNELPCSIFHFIFFDLVKKY